VFAVRGAFRGAVMQLFWITGFVVGAWAAGWVSQWVGEHWQGARPAVVFWVLRWLVGLLAGLSVLALAQWSGERLRSVWRDGPLGWLDRLLGVATGAVLGALVVALLLLATVRWFPRGDLPHGLMVSRLSLPVVEESEQLCGSAARVVPASGWLSREFTLAARRMKGNHTVGSPSHTS
jgi:uncharacterized membrane protein required for colicin V production